MTWSILKLLASMAVGCTLCWLVINLADGPSVQVISQAEAEGPEFSDPNQLDIVTHLRRRRACPAVTQRYVWRWTTYHGARAQQVVPLRETVMPFLSDTETTILTLPNPGVPDLSDKWFFRSVTSEQCAWMPTFLSGWAGFRMFRSADVSVNFVGDPHLLTQEAAP